MTDYQNELVMEHLDLVNWVIRTRISVPNRPLLTYDDFYAIGCEAICRAALKYQSDSGEFAPFACRYRNMMFCQPDGYCGYMTPNVWMFIKTYEKLRNYIINGKSIVSLVQMAKGAFFKEATVDICAFILKNKKGSEKGLYFRLENFKGGMEVQKQKVLEALANKNCGYFYEADQSNFSKIPGSPVAYWWGNFKIFSLPKIRDFYESAGRNKTHNNELYTRNWWEISDIDKWQPYANGGVFRRWAGNDLDVVDWSSSAKEFYASHGGLYNQKYCGKRGVCWNLVSAGRN